MKKYLVLPIIVGAVMSLAAFAFAQTATPAASLSRTPKPKRTVDLACMQTAVEKRDNGIISAVDVYHASIVAALKTRRDALKAVWGLTDPAARKRALNAAWDNFRESRRKAVVIARNVKKASWKQFKIDRKACRADGASEEKGTEADDTQL